MTMLRDEQRFSQFVITVKGRAPERQTVAMGINNTTPRASKTRANVSQVPSASGSLDRF